MKKITLLFGLLFNMIIVLAQSPDAVHYQAVARDALGNIMANQEVMLEISILEDSESGNPVYVETHSITTNDFGIINLNIGEGNAINGSISDLAWGSQKLYLKVRMDAEGSGNYKDMGTSQIVSVPYAKYADEAGNAFSGNYSDLSNKPDLNDYVLFQQTNPWDKDTTNELQTLSRSGYTLRISSKNQIQLPDSIRKAKYASQPSENFMLSYEQVLDKPVLSISGDTIFLSDGGHVVLPDTISYAGIAGSPDENFELRFEKITDIPSDIDHDKSNELQALSLSDDTLSLSDGNYVVLPDSVDFARESASNPKLEKKVDSLSAAMDSINNIVLARSNTFWLSRTDGFYVDQRDGKRYNFSMIGDQVWMTQNLNMGDTLNAAEKPSHNDTIEKFAYDDNPTNLATYGGLYTWTEMMQLPDSCQTANCSDLIDETHQGVCPAGFHIPSEKEWEALIDHLGGNPAGAGGKLKETGTAHWNSPNTGAVNTSDFTARGAGFKSGGFYNELKETAYFGMAKEINAQETRHYQLRYDSENIQPDNNYKTQAVSVRCIMNKQ